MKELHVMPTGCLINNIFKCGYCTQRGFFADQSLGFKKMRFYSRSFLLEHKDKGLILVDTGYGESLKKLADKGIYKLYTKLIPFHYTNEDSLSYQLQHAGISIKDISYLIITHFHPDHIGALPEFAITPWIYRKDTLDTLMHLSPLSALQNGFFKPLVPKIPDFSIGLSKENFNKTWQDFQACDVFFDESLLLIDLPGHALGQMGVSFSNTFLAADASWGGSKLPTFLGRIIQEDKNAYIRTFEKLQKICPSITVHTTHVIEAHE